MGGAGMSEDAFKLHVAAHALCAAIFVFLGAGSLSRIMEPLSAIQTAPLSSRLQWCSSANVYICGMSAVLNLFHITNFETSMQALLGATTAAIIKPLEYIITCPFMMLTLVVLAGDAVPVQRQVQVFSLTSAVLISGFFASFMAQLSVKLMFFGAGVLFFIVLLHLVEKNVREHSSGQESLLQSGHGSPYKALCMKVVSTWILFPVWWLLSAEGLNIVKQPEVNTLVTAVLNILAKGVYVVFVERIRDKYLGEESLMDHPKERSHEIQHALDMAARLGPAGAIQAVVKNIKKEEMRMNYIRTLMVSEGTKVAAEYLADEHCETPRRLPSKGDVNAIPSESDLANFPSAAGAGDSVSPTSVGQALTDAKDVRVFLNQQGTESGETAFPKERMPTLLSMASMGGDAHPSFPKGQTWEGLNRDPISANLEAVSKVRSIENGVGVSMPLISRTRSNTHAE